MSLLVPYTSAMRIGQGFNSFTREVCIDEAVIIAPLEISTTLPAQPGAESSVATSLTPDPTNSTVPNGTSTVSPAPTAPPPASAPALSSPQINQTVVFSSQKIDHLAEILTALNISTYASIKYGTIQGSGSAGYVNEKKVNEADLNYVVTVKVTNEASRNPPGMTFNPIEEIDPDSFTSVFGDCFIADFQEGGEFSAVMSIKTGSNSDTKAVQQAIELQLQTGIPGLTVGAKESVDRKKDNTLSDCEITISVAWTGGGTIRSTTDNWTIEEVISVANFFPNRVAQHSQRTSAVLVDYRSLRSFQIYEVKLKDKKMNVLNYTACHIYSRDLFSAYMAYKALWEEITLMLKSPNEYQSLTLDVDGEKPIGADPVSLNLARDEARMGMTNILQELETLRHNPERALIPFSSDGSASSDPPPATGDASKPLTNGIVKPTTSSESRRRPYHFPALLKARLPRWVGAPMSMSDDLWKDDNWTAEEMAAIMKFTADKENLHFSPPIGDLPKTKGGKAFCTLDVNKKNEKPPDLLTLAIHGHKHDLASNLLHGHLPHFSSTSRGALSSLGLTTSSSPRPSSTSSPCRTATHVGTTTHCQGPGYFNSADVSCGITKVEVGHEPGSGRIASIRFFDRGGRVLLAWDMYRVQGGAGWKVEERPAGVKVRVVVPPGGGGSGGEGGWDGEGVGKGGADGVEDTDGDAGGDNKKESWVLAGFYGQADLVVQQIGMVWKRV